ncbi:IclR family transcriptional regulator [Variovorax humicola]|uniref:IclR family transcriptional regulator n=1 Tax=Variovorax humicola TaxID=1769758 RepID=A0ABU8W3P2_9BURK
MADNVTAADAGSLKRGVQLLKLLATAGSRGLSLTQIADRAALPHPTVHRVLRQLVEERLVARSDELKRYRLGPLAYELGMAGATMYDLRDMCDGAMQALSAETTDTVYLVVRSGFEAVCMHRLEGSFPIRTLVLDVGSRRPLGVGAGGLALLAAIEDEERHQIIERVKPKLSAFAKLTSEELEHACAATRKRGTSLIQDTINLGVSAVGRVFRDSMGQPMGAISVAALSHRMPAQRCERIAELLKDAVTDVERRMRDKSRNGWETGS